MTRQEYIDQFKDVVKEAVKGTGLFPSLMMAQAILESSDVRGVPGNSTLARVYNNHFGVKADASWKGKKVSLITHEVYDGASVIIGDFFRVYEEPTQSFKDRVMFLKKNIRYTKAGVFNAPTPEKQAEALKEAGYATDPKYAIKLQSLIIKHNLQDLDQQVI